MRTTSKERAEVIARLIKLGIEYPDAEALRRIAMTLHSWFERECGDGGGCIERDETTGKAYYLNAMSGKRYPIADRETGAKNRLKSIMAKYSALQPYIQGDCRGASLYILRNDDLRGSNVEQVYNRGVAVY